MWITLFLLVLMKLLFNEWYPIVVEDKLVIKVCDFIDNNYILDYTIRFLFYLTNCFITYLTCCKKIKPNKIEIIVLPLIAILSFIVKTFVNNYFAFIIEMIIVIMISIIINLIKKTFRNKALNVLFPIVINLLLMLWQCNMLFIRGIDNVLTNMSSLISIFIQIDYYIFLIITWIGVVYFMGNLGLWFWSNDITKLKAELEKENLKKEPNQEKIMQIKQRIEQLEKK